MHPAQKEIENNLSGNTHFYSATNRNALTLRRYDERAKRECKEFNTAQTLLVQVLAQREKDRLAMYEKSKQRMATLGLGK